MSDDRHSTTRRIAASPATIFEILTDPGTHPAIDGSGMLDGSIETTPLQSVGDTFDMDMDRTPIGDIPGLVKYQVRNVVTRIETDRLVEWTTGPVDGPPVGHHYGWELDEAADGATDVTHFCDWSGISDEVRSAVPWPVVPLAMLETSLDNLERIAVERSGG